MNRSLIFWVIMLLWLLALVGAIAGWGHYWVIGSWVIAFILFLLLGWDVYGPAVRGK